MIVSIFTFVLLVKIISAVNVINFLLHKLKKKIFEETEDYNISVLMLQKYKIKNDIKNFRFYIFHFKK